MRRIFSFAPEAVYNTYDGVTIAPQLTPMDTPNSFEPMSKPKFWNIQDGSGQNVPRLRGSECMAVESKYQSRAYWETVQYMVMGLSRVNSGQTSPWATDQKLNDLASGSINFAYSYDDETFSYHRYTGNKIASATISGGNQSDAPFLMLDYQFVGSTPFPNPRGGAAPTITDIPTPALTDYPANPITFQECTFKLANVTTNLFDRFSIKIDQKVKAYYDQARFANRIHMRGRTVTCTFHLLLQPGNDVRTTYYEAAAAITSGVSFLFTNPAALTGGHTISQKLKFDFKSNVFIDLVAEEMILDEDAYSEITATALLDVAAGVDFAITYTPES